MYVKVLYDKEAKKGLLSGWGFSCLVGGKILFDTGDNPNSLFENMERMMVPVNDIEAVVISHDHWDHTGGLWEILKKKPGMKVYACPSFSETFQRCVRESGGEMVLAPDPVEISKDIFLSGELKCTYKGGEMGEQALIVKGDKGTSVITGCAHPGIINVIREIQQKLKVDSFYMAFGGFHLEGIEREGLEQIILDFGTIPVTKIGPTHCSGEKARRVFMGKLQENFIPVRAGHIIHL